MWHQKGHLLSPSPMSSFLSPVHCQSCISWAILFLSHGLYPFRALSTPSQSILPKSSSFHPYFPCKYFRNILPRCCFCRCSFISSTITPSTVYIPNHVVMYTGLGTTISGSNSAPFFASISMSMFSCTGRI